MRVRNTLNPLFLTLLRECHFMMPSAKMKVSTGPFPMGDIFMDRPEGSRAFSCRVQCGSLPLALPFLSHVLQGNVTFWFHCFSLTFTPCHFMLFFIFNHIYMCPWEWACVCADGHRVQKTVLDPLELELQAVGCKSASVGAGNPKSDPLQKRTP